MATPVAKTSNTQARNKIRLTKEGVLYSLFVVALLLVSLIQRLNLMTLFFSMTASLMLVTLWLGRLNLRRMAAGAVLPRDVYAGLPVPIEVHVTNSRKRAPALGVSVQLHFLPSNGGKRIDTPEIPLPAIRPLSTLEQSIKTDAWSRGIYRLQKMTLSSRFPFGLFRLLREVKTEGELVLFPSLGRLEGRLPTQLATGSDVSQRSGGQRGTQLDQYRHLRDYRAGDNPRHVHWRSSARRGQLLVKEFEPEGASPTLLLLDPFLPSQDEMESTRFEKLVSFAATMCVEMGRHSAGRGILVVATRSPVLLEGQGTGRWLNQCLYELAAVAASTEDHLNATLLTLQEKKRFPEPHIWVIGLRSAEAYTEALRANLGGDVSARRSRFHCIGAAEVEKFFRWSSQTGYAGPVSSSVSTSP